MLSQPGRKATAGWRTTATASAPVTPQPVPSAEVAGAAMHELALMEEWHRIAWKGRRGPRGPAGFSRERSGWSARGLRLSCLGFAFEVGDWRVGSAKGGNAVAELRAQVLGAQYVERTLSR